MQILITGGAGFIGSHLAERLLKENHHVTVIDNLSTGRISNLVQALNSPNFKYVSGSILDVELLEELVADAEYIFHLGASVGVFNIVNKPLESMLTNIRGTENVLSVADRHSKPVLITSSSEIYGKNTSKSLKETDDRILGSPTTLRWSYSEAKAIDESLAYAYFFEKNLPVRIVRFFNTVGPRQLGTYGMVVPRFIQAALKNDALTIYGDGLQTRCFAHVHDVIDALMLSAFSPNTIGIALNIGNNVEVSIVELAEKIIALTGSKSKITFTPYEKAYGQGFEDMDRRVPNTELIEGLLGWKPKRNLEAIVLDIAQFISNQSESE